MQTTKHKTHTTFQSKPNYMLPLTTVSRTGTASFGATIFHVIFNTILSYTESHLAIIHCQPSTLLNASIIKREDKVGIILAHCRAQVTTLGTSASHILFHAIFASASTGGSRVSMCCQPTTKLGNSNVKNKSKAGIVLA
jgi:hypothetical protein